MTAALWAAWLSGFAAAWVAMWVYRVFPRRRPRRLIVPRRRRPGGVYLRNPRRHVS